jgi:hypothetical protein
MILSQGAGFWQLIAGVIILSYGLLVKFFIADPLGTVPADGLLSFGPMFLGFVIALLGLLRCLGK